MELFSIVIFMGATLTAGAIGYVVGQRRVAPEVEEQSDMLGAEIVRLRRRAQAAERNAAQNKALASRKLRRVRIQH